MVYKWRDGFQASGKVKAEIAGKALEKIRKANGGLEPAHIVEAARPEQHPLHKAFTWDDSIAAESYRRQQARLLVRALVVIRMDGDSTNEEPVYVHTSVASPEEGVELRRFYQKATILVNRPDEWDAAVAMLYGKLQSAAASLDEVRRIAERAKKTAAADALDLAGQNIAAAREAVGGMQ